MDISNRYGERSALAHSCSRVCRSLTGSTVIGSSIFCGSFRSLDLRIHLVQRPVPFVPTETAGGRSAGSMGANPAVSTTRLSVRPRTFLEIERTRLPDQLIERQPNRPRTTRCLDNFLLVHCLSIGSALCLVVIEQAAIDCFKHHRSSPLPKWSRKA